MNDPFARLGALMVKLRWVVLVCWIIILPVAGALGASKAASVLKGGGFVVAGSDSAKAADVLAKRFNASGDNNALVVLHSSSLTVDDPAFQSAATTAVQNLKGVAGVNTVVDFYDTHDPSLVSADRHTMLVLAVLNGDEDAVQKLVPKLRDALAGVKGLDHYVAGGPAIAADLQTTSEEDLKRAERFTIPIVVILLLLVFRTVVSAAIPLILGVCSVVPAIALLYVVGSRTDVSVFALNIASMLGLGLGIDFSLIVVNRYREELAAGYDPRTAVEVTMATAGRSITYSGSTVLLGMLILTLLLNLMMVRSMSMAVAFVALTALLAGLTLLPALLGILGRRIEWLPVLPRPKVAQAGHEGFWYRLSHAIMRRPWIWLAVSVALLVALASPARNLGLLGATAGVLPSSVESAKGVQVLDNAFGAPRLSPIQIVIESGQQNGVWKPEFLDSLTQLTDKVKADPRVQGVNSLVTLVPNLTPEQARQLTPQTFTSDPAKAGAAAQYVNLQGANDTAVINVLVKTDEYNNDHQNLVRDLRDTVISGIPQLRAYTVLVGGNSASFIDLQHSVYSRFPLVIAVTMLLTFLMLMMFFQSLALPLKAILMNLASIAATYGVLVMIFQYGWGHRLINLEPLGKINVVTPVILFVVLLGLSTDYEVFMLSRVKEYYHETGHNEEAVAAGLESTARVITAAGLILIGTFGSFALADVVVIKEFGIGLAAGVLIDSTIVRVIMVPATMRLMGKGNWWMPAWLKKIVPELKEGPSLAPAPAGALAAPGFAALAQQVEPQVAFNAPLPPQPAYAPQPLQQPAAYATPAPQAASAGPPRLPGGDVNGWLIPTGSAIGMDQIPLPRRRAFRIGRDSQAEMWLFDQRVSRFHARIDYDPQLHGFVVADLKSVNGVYVNGQRIAAPTLLRNGDHLEIGTVGDATFTFYAQPVGEALGVRR
ncbi:MAG TPA: MMPL family transporter [Thermomicrobiales bacterium]|nr:MMPL family transporter [Thermomicrobiales bacterium]